MFSVFKKKGGGKSHFPAEQSDETSPVVDGISCVCFVGLTALRWFVLLPQPVGDGFYPMAFPKWSTKPDQTLITSNQSQMHDMRQRSDMH